MTGLLLINLGTPDAPNAKSVRRYLRQFLSDPEVIDINPVLRWLLVNLIIAPLRAPKSTAAYRKIWMPEGSPLLINTLKLAKALQIKLSELPPSPPSTVLRAGFPLPRGERVGERVIPEGFAVQVGMRYGEPSISHALWRLNHRDISKILVLPLYPQYAFSSVKTAVDEVHRVLQTRKIDKPFEILSPFYEHPGFIRAFAEIGRPIMAAGFDHVLFSFHGLPERHIQKGDPYQDHCFKTAEALTRELSLKDGEYSVSFQSRLGRTPWIKPYTDLILPELAREGKKRVIVFCPSFVADCLETLEEIGIRGRKSFMGAGGENLILVPSPNESPGWVETVSKMVIAFSNHAQSQPGP